MTTYILLLRGINVGGHKKVPMAELRHLLSELGFKHVKTVLASGNALFDAPEQTESALLKKIEPAFVAQFDFEAAMMIFPLDQLRAWVDLDPLAGHELVKPIRGYVTFLPKPVPAPWSLPHESLAGDLIIVAAMDRAVFSVIDHSGKHGSPEAMKIWEATFGENITTRSWNTVLKLIEKANP